MWDVNKARPLGKWVFVEEDPRRCATKGGILLPDMQTKAEKVSEGTGRLLKVGRDVEKTVGYKLESGMRICYRGFLTEVFHEFKCLHEGQRVFMLRAEDIIAVIDESVTMGVYS